MDNKFPKIRVLGDSENEGIFDYGKETVVQEKLDGSCTSFYVENGCLIFCSRNRVMGMIVDPMWKRAAQFINEKFAEKPHAFEPDLIYFGETMEKHTITYKDPPPFVGFDIMDKNTGMFFSWERSKYLFEKMGIPFAPVLMCKQSDHFKFEELQQLVDKLKSQYGDMAEGIVLKRYDKLNKFGRPLWSKMVKDSFKERNRLAFNKIKTHDDAEKQIVEEFCTSARVRKVIQKLTLEEGQELSMKLMPFLFKAVAEDILTEEILNIQAKYQSIQFKELTKLVANRCARELKNQMGENANK